MDVGTVVIIGITVVFFSFFLLYLLFRVLERVFAQKQTSRMKRVSAEPSESVAELSSTPQSKIPEWNLIEENDEEEAAAIMAALSAYLGQPAKIHAVYPLASFQKALPDLSWRNHRHSSWKTRRKGVGFQ